MSAAPPSGSVIEVFADLCCPFTHVGLRRLAAARDEHDPEVRLWVRAWPLELVNGQPLDGAFIAEEVDDIRRQVAPELFAGFAAEVMPASSMPGMALAARAYERGAVVGEAVSLELRDLLFEQGVDVADPAVLRSVAERHGIEPLTEHVDETGVRADLEEGRRRGVVGSPQFFTPGGSFFCPALDISRDARGHLRIHTDPEGFDAFVASCFT